MLAGVRYHVQVSHSRFNTGIITYYRMHTIVQSHSGAVLSRRGTVALAHINPQVLKAYAPLWAGLRRKGARRARLVIVNLQWTPKDAVADLTIAAEVR